MPRGILMGAAEELDEDDVVSAVESEVVTEESALLPLLPLGLLTLMLLSELLVSSDSASLSLSAG